jgi:hypothetical protein
MTRRALGVIAIMLIGLMAIVATAGLDNLPRSLKKSVDSSSGLLQRDIQTLQEDQSQVDHALTAEPVLFQREALPWRSRLGHDRSQLDAAAAKLASIEKLAKADRRTDRDNVKRGLAEFNLLREDALRDASGIRSETERWVASKHALPARVQAMHASYDALLAVDADNALAQVRKALTDWPAKRDDLQKRLDGLQELKNSGQTIWDSSAELRSLAEASTLADWGSVGTLLSQATQLDALAGQAKESMAAVNALAAQLYVSWDKLLLDVDQGRDARQKIRIVRTRYPDATLQHGETTSEEHWEPLSAFAAREAGYNTGMVIERKPAGEYDSEAQRTVQPPAYAYIAPPGESNRYGSWSGGIWHWLPEYLILSQLLHASRGPVSEPDYESYQNARRRGEVFYGRNLDFDFTRQSSEKRPGYSYSRPPPFSAPSSGGWYRERAPSSDGEQGYAGSRYQSRGTFSGSRYQSRGTYRSSGGMRSFSHAGRR